MHNLLQPLVRLLPARWAANVSVFIHWLFVVGLFNSEVPAVERPCACLNVYVHGLLQSGDALKKDICGYINVSLVVKATHILTAISTAKPGQPRTARKLERAHGRLLAYLEKIDGEILRRQVLDREEIIQEEGEKKEMV